MSGHRWLTVSIVATVVFLAADALALLVDSAGVVVVAVSVALFAVGVVAMAAAFWVGIGRSRTEEVTMYGLFLGADGVLPPAVRRIHFGLVAIQAVVGIVGGLYGGEAPAFGVLVVQAGFGLLALDGATTGVFPPRGPDRDSAPGSRESA